MYNQNIQKNIDFIFNTKLIIKMKLRIFQLKMIIPNFQYDYRKLIDNINNDYKY